MFLSLSEMATMLAKYTRDAQNDLNPASKIFKSVAKHPEMINDIDGFDTELVRAFNHSAIAKRGAMAVFVVGINTIKYGQIGIAIKLIDGDSTPMPPIVLKVLEKLEVIDSSELEMLQKFRIVEQYNWNKIFTGKFVRNCYLIRLVLFSVEKCIFFRISKKLYLISVLNSCKISVTTKLN